MGVAICEDLWNDKTFWKERLYTFDPVEELIAMCAELLVAINASPFNKGKMERRGAVVARRAKAAGVPLY